MLGIVPARGGSRGIKGKNLQTLGGKPLFLAAADTLSQHCDTVVVATDDPTVASIARIWGYQVHVREPVPATQPVIDVAREVVAGLSHRGPTVLLQPTVPVTFDFAQWLREVSTTGVNDGEFVQLLDAAVAGTPAGHILWGSTFDLIGERRNRQELSEWPMKEIGLYWWNGEVKEPTMIVPVRGEAVDIDTPGDLAAARHTASRKSILIRYVADEERGTGHVRRMLTLAEALQHHDIVFQAGDKNTHESEWPEKIGELWPHASPSETHIGLWDLLVTDTLDNGDVLQSVAPQKWVTFEDRGFYAPYADLTINALYGRQGWRNERTGPDWAILRPEFQHLPPYNITDQGRVLVMFGGTDPARLRDKTEEAVTYASGVSKYSVLGPWGDWNVAEALTQHDLLITSAGRTVYEAAAVGIPAIVMAQNNREATHVHLDPHHGNIYMGLGRLVTVEDLRHTIEQVLADEPLRRELSATARKSIDGHGLDRVVSEIGRILEGR